jgi:hypothetical protein
MSPQNPRNGHPEGVSQGLSRRIEWRACNPILQGVRLEEGSERRDWDVCSAGRESRVRVTVRTGRPYFTPQHATCVPKKALITF